MTNINPSNKYNIILFVLILILNKELLGAKIETQNELLYTNTQVYRFIDSLNCHNKLIQEYQDSLKLINVKIAILESKLDNNIVLVSNWGVYSSILAGVLLVLSIGSNYIVSSRAKHVAHEEMRESKEELNKELEKIKKLEIKANQKYQEFNTYLELTKEEADKKTNGNT